MQKYLNEITPEDLEEIKRLSAMFFTPRDIAMILEIETEMFLHYCEVEDHKACIAFNTGRLMSEMELRASIIKLAKSGSSPAQTMALDMLNKSKMKMLDK